MKPLTIALCLALGGCASTGGSDHPIAAGIGTVLGSAARAASGPREPRVVYAAPAPYYYEPQPYYRRPWGWRRGGW
jgi:hypothetical protein